VTVPLDRSGTVTGTVSLSVERSSALPGAHSESAVLALAGGPGQAALGLGEFVASAMAPELGGRDLVLFDQRGTGESDRLRCAALEHAHGVAAGALERCAQQIGPARRAYTTAESVADIEAVRQALGYSELVLYGTSYGTKVALDYAQRYPQHVQALVLDSIVPPDGPEPFAIPTFQAIKGALAEICARRACAGITARPASALARLVARLRRHSLSGAVYDGRGRRHRARLSELDLLGIVQAGDLNPALRALLPAAITSALRHDPDPLLRLQLLAEGLIPTLPGHRHARAGARVRTGRPAASAARSAAASAEAIDEALFADTSCEETPFPWQRAASPALRLIEARNALRALPAGDFSPFDRATAFANSLIPLCAGWPDASPPPGPGGAPPDVPTLILSGAQDLRTPTANARHVAAQIPGAQLVVVPFTGHSVLGSDFSGCAEAAVASFAAGGAAQACAGASNLFSPTPVTPERLADVRAPSALKGRAGRTLVAVLDSILDLDRQVIGATLQADRELPGGSSFGGLRGGYARLEPTAVVLHRLAFVSGVRLSGTLPIRGARLGAATLTVTGRAAAHGVVRVGASHTVSGTLAGRRFDIHLAALRLARVARAHAREWPPRPLTFPLPALARLR
jgi:pimeloyl-ACP methyl ester carboxylesterase